MRAETVNCSLPHGCGCDRGTGGEEAVAAGLARGEVTPAGLRASGARRRRAAEVVA